MLVKYQKCVLKVMIFIMIFTACFIGYRYYCGWLLVRQAADNISTMIINENCLASEAIYSDGVSTYSMQDKARDYLESLGESKNVDFDFSSGLISLDGDTPINAWYEKNGTSICPNSYLNAAQKGTLITVKINGTMEFKITIMPSWNDDEPFVVKIPISVTRKKNALDFYKAQEDNRNY